MASYGSLVAYLGSVSSHIGGSITGSLSTYVMTSQNTAWAHRFMAYDTRDITAVHINFSAVSSPGTVTARIETIDASTGKPTGNLYDANATKSFTPSAGWNDITFNTPPTTGLTAGVEYAFVLIKDNAGTTCTLNARSPMSNGGYPGICLLAADGSTRSNFSEQAGYVGMCYFTLDDGAVELLGGIASLGVGNHNVYGSDIVAGLKLVLPCDIKARSFLSPSNIGFIRNGTPAGDLRFRILNSSNEALFTVTLDKDSLTNMNTRGLYIPIPVITLTAGTYRLAFDSAGSVNSSNCYALVCVDFASSLLQSSAYSFTHSTNASTSFTWTDLSSRSVSCGLELDSIPVAASGGAQRVYGG